jgi:uncharacterized delta-60 repeat protein
MRIFFLSFFFLYNLSSRCQEGLPDMSFGNNGIALYTPNDVSSDSRTDIAVQKDGKILMLGNILNAGSLDYLIIRFNRNGTIDNSFNGAGHTIISNADWNDYPGAITIQKDGKIILVGSSEQLIDNSYKSRFAVIRLNSDGSLDHSFNGNGKVFTSFGNTSAHAHSIALQVDGRIVVGGDSDKGFGGPNLDFAIARYLPNGVLDSTFSGDGKVITTIDNINNERIFSVAIQPDGKIVGVGFTSKVALGNITQFAVIRYNANGVLDSSFNGNGIAVQNSSFGHDFGRAVIVQNDGKILVTGQTMDTAGLKLVRHNSDGTPDNKFGTAGVVILNIDTASGWKLLLQNDKKVIIAATINDGGVSKFCALCIKENGLLDSSFGQNGKTIIPVKLVAYVRTAAFQDDKILIGGKSYEGSGVPIYTIVRLNNNLGPSNNNSKNIILYPNPTQDNIKLKFLGYDETVVIVLFDAIGRTIRIQKNFVTDQSIVEIESHFLPQAVYQIAIQTEDGKIVKRFIKLH